MKQILRKTLVVVLVASLAITGVVPQGGPVGEASASHECSLSESTLALMFAGPSLIGEAAGGSSVGCDIFHDEEVNVDNDAEQIEIDLYQSTQNSKAQAEIYDTTLDNYLEDTRTQAKIVGTNAYIRALENGSSEPAARTQARGAIADYYTVKQMNLIESWNTTLAQFIYVRGVTENESDIRDDYIDYIHDNENWWSSTDWPGGSRDFNPDYQSPTTVTLANGSTKAAANPDTTGRQEELNPWTQQGETWNIVVRPPNQNYENFELANLSHYKSRHESIESQNQAVQDQVDVFINNTFDAYQRGDIETDDLIDPYNADRNYSPDEDYQAWALSMLSDLGYNSPMNLSEVGYMEVEDHSSGQTHTGILMSDGLPENDTFAVGERYNATEIGGYQYVVTGTDKYELTGEFTLKSATDSEGNEETQVTYRNVTYETADMSEYRELMQELADLRAELEAEEKAGAGGGGFLDWGEGSKLGVIALAVAVGALLLGRSGN